MELLLRRDRKRLTSLTSRYGPPPFLVKAENDRLGFVSSIQSRDTYWLLHDQLPAQQALLLKRLMRDCRFECERLAGDIAKQEGDEYLKAAEAEIQRLKEAMVDCNVKALRQVASVTSTVHHPIEEVELYDALEFVDDKTREMVMEIVAYKLWQIGNGSAPDWLVGMLKDKLLEAKLEEEAEEIEDEEEANRKLRNDNSFLTECSTSLGDNEARDRIEELELQLSQVLQKVAVVERERAQEETRLQQDLAAMKERAEEASRESLQLRSCIEASENKQRSKAEGMKDGGNDMHEDRQEEVAVARLSADGDPDCDVWSDGRVCRRIQTAICEVRGWGAGSCQDRAQIEGLQSENTKLKLLLEELRAKLCDLMTESRKKGLGPHMELMTEKVGLKWVLRADSVFSRLYQDAMDRVVRLEKLRERVHREEEGALCAIIRECSNKQMDVPPNILAALEKSRLHQQLPTPVARDLPSDDHIWREPTKEVRQPEMPAFFRRPRAPGFVPREKFSSAPPPLVGDAPQSAEDEIPELLTPKEVIESRSKGGSLEREGSNCRSVPTLAKPLQLPDKPPVMLVNGKLRLTVTNQLRYKAAKKWG
eukprot:TRINITY_DN112905_c0_g1_i1.p1 TRINITY_DN112905_c0_g1~~TRINITY_DN112905_c0_g1_i1.p1  ORF type:complete len:593 (+),score=181.96 TRINITY_DN112905_c0_g1_i1:119-1897(+)